MEKPTLKKRLTKNRRSGDTASLGNNKSFVTGKEPKVLPKKEATFGISLHSRSQISRIVSFSVNLVQLCGLSIFIGGLVLRGQFHNGDECGMTYSVREFLEIDTSHLNSSPATKDYRLHKFVDRRDPRFQNLLVAERPLRNETDWCSRHSSSLSKRIVLYIPGHWGSYGQSRSVGAHGLQMTRRSNGQEVSRALNALSNGLWTGDAKSERSFLYDVYSVDFGEQGAALHGKFLMWQSDFVASTVQLLADACDVKSVTIVAHSMGGLVARLAPILHPETTLLLPNIITLATPHSNPLYGFDKSIHEIHTKIQNEQQDETLVVSLSGGLKDEMIEESSCYVNRKISLTVLPSQLLPHFEFGMDHQAIVWCHGILHQVRRVIWALSMAENKSAGERLESVQNILGIDLGGAQEDISSMASLRSKYGIIRSASVECAMFYNLPLLLCFFCFIGGLRCTYPDVPATYDGVFLGIAIVFGWVACDMRKESVVVLCLVASLVHSITTKVIPVGFLTGNKRAKYIVWRCLALILAVDCICLATGRLVFGTWSLEHFELVLFLCTILSVYLSLFLMVGLAYNSSGQSLEVEFALLVFFVLPVVIVGALSAASWDGATEARSWWTLLNQLLPIACFCAVKCTLNSASWRWLTLVRSVLLTHVVFKLCLRILRRGQGFVFAKLTQEIAWVHIIVDLVQVVCDANSRLAVSGDKNEYHKTVK